MKKFFNKIFIHITALTFVLLGAGALYATTLITSDNVWTHTAVVGDTMNYTAWNELVAKAQQFSTACNSNGQIDCRAVASYKAGVPQVGITNAPEINIAGTTGVGEFLVKASAGFFDGVNDFLKVTDLDLIAANIKSGINILGITGTASTGTNLDNIYVLNPARCGDGVLQADKEWSDAGSDVCERIPDIQLISKACTDLGAACTDVTTPATYIVKVALMNPTVVSTTSTVLSFVDAVGEGVTELVNTCNNITLNEAFSECSVEYTTTSGNRDASFHFAYTAPDGKEALITGSTNISASPTAALLGTATHNTFTFDFMVDDDVVSIDFVAEKETSANMAVTTNTLVATADNGLFISNAYLQDGIDGDWIENTPSFEYKLPVIDFEADSTSMALKSFNVLTQGDNVRLYNATDGLIDGVLGATASVTANSTGVHNILEDGSVVATYNLEGNANDLSGNYNGVATNVTYGTGKFGQGITQATSDGIVIINSGLFNSSMVVSLWVKMQDYSPAIAYYAIGDGGNHIIFTPATGWSFTTSWPNDVITGVAQSATPLNTWTHIVMVAIQGVPTKVYINGSEATYTLSGTNNGTTNRTVTAISLLDNSGNNAYTFNGLIDQVRIFNKALTSTEVTALYNESVTKYTSDITALGLTNPPTKAWFDKPVTVSTCTEATAGRCNAKDETLTVTGTPTTTTASGTSAISGLIETGDNVLLDGASIATTLVVETDLGGGSYQYDLTFAVQGSAPTTLAVADRSTTTTEASDVYDSINDKFVKIYNKTIQQGRAFKYKISADRDVEVTKVTIPMNKRAN